MRTLRKDYAKYAAEDDDFNDMQVRAGHTHTIRAGHTHRVLVCA